MTNLELSINEEGKTKEFDFKNDLFALASIQGSDFDELEKIIIKNVPDEIHYELSKLIFNKCEIHNLKKQNEQLSFKMAKFIF